MNKKNSLEAICNGDLLFLLCLQIIQRYNEDNI